VVWEVLEIGEVPESVEMFFSSVNVEGNSKSEIRNPKEEIIVTTSSRSIGVVGIADSIEEARLKAVEGVSKISGKIFYRKDIGSSELIGKRVEMMKKIRG